MEAAPKAPRERRRRRGEQEITTRVLHLAAAAGRARRRPAVGAPRGRAVRILSRARLALTFAIKQGISGDAARILPALERAFRTFGRFWRRRCDAGARLKILSVGLDSPSGDIGSAA